MLPTCNSESEEFCVGDGGAPTSPHGRTGAEKWGIGKPTSSPGLMSVEVLADILGVTAFPQNQLGTNYATSGVRTKIQGSSSSFGIFILYNSNPACSVPAVSTNITAAWASGVLADFAGVHADECRHFRIR
jgi:hypothetical protein